MKLCSSLLFISLKFISQTHTLAPLSLYIYTTIFQSLINAILLKNKGDLPWSAPISLLNLVYYREENGCFYSSTTSISSSSLLI